jgi:hypothetical protein
MQINAAMNSLPSTGGTIDARNIGSPNTCSASINFPSGRPLTLLLGANTYPLANNSINVNQSGAQIIGLGPGTTTITYNGPGSAIESFPTSQPQNNRYEGFGLSYTGTGSTQGIYIVNPIGNIIRNVSIQGFTGACVNFQALNNEYGTLNTIDNVSVTSCANYGIIIQGSTANGQIVATRIVNSFIQTDATQGVGVDLKLSGAQDTFVSGSYFAGTEDSAGIGVWITPDFSTGSAASANYSNLVGNFFEQLGEGIQVDSNVYNTTEIGTNSWDVSNLRNYNSPVKTY